MLDDFRFLTEAEQFKKTREAEEYWIYVYRCSQSGKIYRIFIPKKASEQAKYHTEEGLLSQSPRWFSKLYLSAMMTQKERNRLKNTLKA